MYISVWSHLGGYSFLLASADREPLSLNRKPVAIVPTPKPANRTALLRPEIRRVKELAIFLSFG